MKLKKETKYIGSILFINLIFKETIDLFLTPVLIVELGYFISLLITTSIYALSGIILVKIYDYYKIDLSKIKKQIKHRHGRNFIKKILTFNLIIIFSKKIKSLSWELFWAFQNPGLVVIYRRDILSTGFSGKNIKLIFVAYLLITNIYWNILIYFGINVWEILLEFTKQHLP